MNSRLGMFVLATIAIFGCHAAMNTRKSISETGSVSEGLVNDSLRIAYAEGAGVDHSGGFMYRGDRPGHAYSSQWGLQYRALAAIPFLATRHALSRLTFGLLTAMTLSLIVLAIHRELGALPALVTMAGLAVSAALAQLSMNLYWALFLFFAPFAAACLFYPKTGNLGRFALFCAAIAVLLCLKSLCGYEMLSSILAAALVPMVYYETRRRASRGQIFLRACAILAAGIIGFLAAISLHLYSLTNYLGSWEKCRDEVKHVILFRTVGEQGFQVREFARSLMMFFGYFINQEQPFYLIAAFLVLYAWHRLLKAVGDMPTARKEFNRALALLLFAFAASISWNVLAWGHMRHHLQVDYLIFYLPFNIVVLAVCGYAISRIQAIAGRDTHV